MAKLKKKNITELTELMVVGWFWRDYCLPFHFIFSVSVSDRIGCHSPMGYVIWFSHINHMYSWIFTNQNLWKCDELESINSYNALQNNMSYIIYRYIYLYTPAHRERKKNSLKNLIELTSIAMQRKEQLAKSIH